MEIKKVEKFEIDGKLFDTQNEANQEGVKIELKNLCYDEIPYSEGQIVFDFLLDNKKEVKRLLEELIILENDLKFK